MRESTQSGRADLVQALALALMLLLGVAVAARAELQLEITSGVRDPVPTQLYGFTRLGLFELTRARRGATLAGQLEALEKNEEI